MLSYSAQSIDESDIEAVTQALRATNLTQGERVVEFERALCEYTGAKYALAMNSATSALYAAYVAHELKDCYVITTPISFVATSNMLLLSGARIIFCDVNEWGNICAESLECEIKKALDSKKRLKAVVSVDIGGISVDVEAITALCEKYNLIFISDSSHALGSEYRGRKVGSLANCTIFSFHPLKPITTLEGGALLCDDFRIYAKAKLIRSHGVEMRGLFYDVTSLGFNFRLSDVACALGLSQLKRLDSFISKRKEIAMIYQSAFEGLKYLTLPNFEGSSLHLYQVLLHEKVPRDVVLEKLREKGIFAQVHYLPICEFTLYQNHPQVISPLFLRGAKRFSSRVLALPCHQGMKQSDAMYVEESLLEILESVL